MANVYVEARPEGRREGSPVDDDVVEDHTDSVLRTFRTQHLNEEKPDHAA